MALNLADGATVGLDCNFVQAFDGQGTGMFARPLATDKIIERLTKILGSIKEKRKSNTIVCFTSHFRRCHGNQNNKPNKLNFLYNDNSLDSNQY